MTREEIMAMPAGLELDALVAERVMGWKFRKPTHGTCCTCQRCGRDYDACGFGCCYSDDIAAAWQAVEKVGERFCVGVENGVWRANFGLRDTLRAETAPLAICRAALLTTLEKS